jgi:hypothetical protein
MPRARYTSELQAATLDAVPVQVAADPGNLATYPPLAPSRVPAVAEFGELPPRGMIRSFLAACLIVLSGLLWGCSTGINCPFDPPACCDNVLTGCGTFDLPSGCSCSDYFLYSYQASSLPQTPVESVMLARQSKVRSRRISAVGTWRATARKTDPSACPRFPTNVAGALVIREAGARVTMKLAGYGALKGLRARNTVRAKGAYKVPALGCVAFVQSQLALTNQTSSAYSVALDWRCENRAHSCSVKYQGSAKKD